MLRARRSSRSPCALSLRQPAELSAAPGFVSFIGHRARAATTTPTENQINAVRDVVAIVGSLRRESLNRKMAMALRAMAPPSLKIEIVEIGDLPLYNQDLDAAPPPPATAFKDRVRKADAVLFVTPEYNRSVPGVLKNPIDVASRPKGQSAWNG